MPDVVVVGELNADLIVTGEAEPVFGQAEKLVDAADLTLGSSSAIFACGAARLGLEVAFIGKTGDDLFGEFVRLELQACGVDTRAVIVDPNVKTGLSLILSRKEDRAILTYPGSIGALRYMEVDQNMLSNARHLHLGSYFLLDQLRPDIVRLFTAARENHLSISLDTNFDPAQEWNRGLEACLPLVDLFLPNETELKAVTHQANLKVALEQMSQIVPLTAVKLGAQGACAKKGPDTFYAAALPVDVVDTTGAGDSFDAGFVYGYLMGWGVEKTLRLAVACGSLSTRQPGGTRAQPTLPEVMEVL